MNIQCSNRAKLWNNSKENIFHLVKGTAIGRICNTPNKLRALEDYTSKSYARDLKWGGEGKGLVTSHSWLQTARLKIMYQSFLVFREFFVKLHDITKIESELNLRFSRNMGPNGNWEIPFSLAPRDFNSQKVSTSCSIKKIN